MPRITLELEQKIIDVIKKRADRGLFSLKEQMEDILRKSAARTKLKRRTRPLKVDDSMVGIFSRQKSGRRKRKKK